MDIGNINYFFYFLIWKDFKNHINPYPFSQSADKFQRNIIYKRCYVLHHHIQVLILWRAFQVPLTQTSITLKVIKSRMEKGIYIQLQDSNHFFNNSEANQMPQKTIDICKTKIPCGRDMKMRFVPCSPVPDVRQKAHILFMV